VVLIGTKSGGDIPIADPRSGRRRSPSGGRTPARSGS
jgi:hypothetical protein